MNPIHEWIVKEIVRYTMDHPPQPSENDWERIHKQYLEYGPHWLGLYQPAPFGDGIAKIWLHRERISRLFWATIGFLESKSPPVEDAHYADICGALVWKTYAHEQFHLCSDRIRKGENFDRDLEEALATTWGWRVSQAYLKDRPVPPEIAAGAIRFWFDGITAPGYTDWKKYSHRCRFLWRVCDYLKARENYSHEQSVTDLMELAADDSNMCEYHVHSELPDASMWHLGGQAAYSGRMTAKGVKLPDDTNTLPPEMRSLLLSEMGIESPETAAKEVNQEVYEEQVADCKLLCLGHNNLTSFKNIHKYIDGKKLAGTVLCLHGNDLTDNVLGLSLLNLKCIYFDDSTVEKAFKECHPDIHALQERLIDAGLSRLARL